MTGLLLALFLVAVVIFVHRGVFATDTIFTAGVILWHVPLIVLAQSPEIMGNMLSYLTARYSLDRYDTLVLQACIAAPLGFWLGGQLRRRLTRRKTRTHAVVMRPWTRGVQSYQLIFGGLWLMALALNSMSYVTRSGSNYAANIGAGAATIHPVVDWFLIYCYLVMMLVFLARYSVGHIRVSVWKVALAFVPLMPLFLSGSRQAFLGPVLALFVLSLPLERRNSFWFSIVFLVMVSTLPFVSNAVRMSRVAEAENLAWGDAGGYVGFLFELGRTVRLVGWAVDYCANIDPAPLAYIAEATKRLLMLGGDIENLSIVVGRGGGNGFTFVAEAVCVAGPSGVALWSFGYGLVLGAFFSVRIGPTSSIRERFIFAFYLSAGVMWPRDEILGYIREMAWFGILPTYVFFRYVRVPRPMTPPPEVPDDTGAPPGHAPPRPVAS